MASNISVLSRLDQLSQEKKNKMSSVERIGGRSQSILFGCVMHSTSIQNRSGFSMHIRLIQSLTGGPGHISQRSTLADKSSTSWPSRSDTRFVWPGTIFHVSGYGALATALQPPCYVRLKENEITQLNQSVWKFTSSSAIAAMLNRSRTSQLRRQSERVISSQLKDFRSAKWDACGTFRPWELLTMSTAAQYDPKAWAKVYKKWKISSYCELTNKTWLENPTSIAYPTMLH